jgi:hypothetical protein
MITYKYRSNYERDIELLKQGKIYVPTIEKLNDPFEGLLIPTIISEIKQFGDVFTNQIETINSLLDKRKRIGIYSLSRTYKHELLWAHYADSHKGFCIEFDVTKLIDFYYLHGNAINFVNTLSVVYKNQPPKVELADLHKEKINDFLEKLIGTKSKNWKYEKEYRVLFEDSGQIKFDYRAIKAIYFGLRAEKTKIDYVMSEINFDVKYYQMYMDENYNLYRKKLDRDNPKNEFKRPDKTSLVINESDNEFLIYRDKIKSAIKIVEKEPYLETIFYAGVDRERIPGKVLIKINAERDKNYAKYPIKFFYFEIKNRRLKRLLL